MYDVTLYGLDGRLIEPVKALTVHREEGWLGVLCDTGVSTLLTWYPAHRVYEVRPVSA